MAASLPYPSLYATHGGVWTAAGPAGSVRGIGRGEAIALAAESPMVMINIPLIGQRLGYPELSGLDLLELSPSSIRAFRGAHAEGHRRSAGPCAASQRCRGGTVPAGGGQSFAGDAGARLARTGRCLGLRAGLHRLRWTWAPALVERLPMPARDEPWLFSRLPNGGNAALGPAASIDTPRSGAGRRQLTALTGGDAELRQGQMGLCSAAAGASLRDGGRPAPSGAGRGGHGNRQDSGLSGAGLAVGRRCRRRGLGLDLHQGAAASAGPRIGAPVPRPRRAAARS